MTDQTDHNQVGEHHTDPMPSTVAVRAPTVTWDPVDDRGGITFTSMDNPKLVIHTTETPSNWVPNYPYPPHLTINLEEPDRIWQHVTGDKGAYALKSAPQSPNYEAGAVYQVEHIAYAKDTPNQSDLWYHSLAREIVWFHRNKGVPLTFAAPFVDSSGYGNWSGRMNASEFAAFSGICGHQHVNDNCVAADTPILCADLIWRPAGDLLSGDELIAFDESSPNQEGRRLRRSTVVANDVQPDALVLVNTSEGSVRCNREHPWLVRRGRGRSKHQNQGEWGHWEWVRTADLESGDHTMYVLEPWQPDRSHDSGWLAGMYDADGWLSTTALKTSALGLGQREELAYLIDEAELLLKTHGIDPGRIRREMRGYGLKGGGEYLARVSGYMIRIQIQNRAAIMRALGVFRPKRLLADSAKAWEGASLGRLGKRVEIESTEPYGRGLIAALTTSTRTYIADGFAMHNSHWDPGALDIPRLKNEIDDWMEQTDPTDPMVPVEEEEMILVEGAGGNGVTSMQEALNAWSKHANKGWKVAVDGTWEKGSKLTERLKEYQRALNFTDTGQLDGLTASYLLRFDPPNL